MSAPLAFVNRPTRRKPLAIGVAAVFALAGSTAVHATTWAVNDCTDGTASGQFRWAVNGAISGDTIDLTQLAPAYQNCANTLQNGFKHQLLVSSTVSVADGVTIQGPGRNELAISGFGSNIRVINSTGNLAINDLGVEYGSGVGTGACIRASKDITLTNVEAYKCYAYAKASNPAGGAIYSSLGSVTMTGGYINHAAASSVSGRARGGAIYGYTGVSLTDTTIINSVSTTQTGSAEGGGVFNFGKNSGDLSISGTEVHGVANVTGTGGHAYGGAIASRSTTHMTNHSYVAGQATTNSNGEARGGGVYSIGLVLLDKSDISDSRAYSKGGGSYGGGIYTQGEAWLQYSSVRDSGAALGSAILSNSGLNVSYSMIATNSASISGGAINRTAGNTTVRGSVFLGNAGNGALDASAGGNTSIVIANSTFNGNVGTLESTLYLVANSVTLDNSTIAYNTSGDTWPAALISGSGTTPTVEIHSTLIASNASGSGRNDLNLIGTSFSNTSSHNFIRDPNPGTSVPADTIVGKCPLLHPLKLDLSEGAGYWNRFILRPSIKSEVVDAGSNPFGLGSDQRGGATDATKPERVSGAAADIGAYEVNQDDIIFDSEFEGCQ